MAWHDPIEKKPFLFLILAAAVVMIGTTVTMIAPFRWINDPKNLIQSVKPYTPLQLEGRDIYIREGCNNCHSQTVRPLVADTARYGDHSKTGEFVYDRPFLWGSRRMGPDLARIGGKYPDAWHYRHMENPQAMVAKSNMPAYAFLNRPLDTSLTEKKLKTLGFPYTQADIEALKGKTEMDAMVAYLQKVGNDIPWRKAQVATVEKATNPFAGDASVVPEGKKIYDENCALCHGNDLKGGIGVPLKGTRLADGDLFKVVFEGRADKGMPAFGGTLGKDKVWKAVNFILKEGK